MREFISVALLVFCLIFAASIGWGWIGEESEFSDCDVSEAILFSGCLITAALCCKKSVIFITH